MAEPQVQLKKFDYTGILGWSVSRFDRFSACKRQYYYDYYAKFDSEFTPNKINALKKMTSVPLETGNIVHDVIKTLLERLLESEQPIIEERFIEYARKKTNEYVSSKQFSEMYYGETQKIDMARVSAQVELILKNLITSQRYSWILGKALGNKKGWIIEPPGYGETRIKGLKAYCKVDFLFPVEGKIYILDWKTGKPDQVKHRKQLLGYSTWAAYHFDTKPEDIEPIVVYLQPVYSEMSEKMTASDITGFVGTVDSETKQMYSYLKNIEQNVPKDKSEFAMTENLKICKYCNYRELCSRAKEKFEF
jgi:hypothetical protein